MSKRYYWLKLPDDWFRQKSVKKLRRIAGGDTYTIIYLKMLLTAIKQDSRLYFEGIEENFHEELALEIDEDPENVKIALAYLMAQNLVQVVDETEFTLPEATKLVGSESASAERMRRHREKKASLCYAGVTTSDVGVTARLRLGDVEKEIETRDKRRDRDIYSPEASSGPDESDGEPAPEMRVEGIDMHSARRAEGVGTEPVNGAEGIGTITRSGAGNAGSDTGVKGVDTAREDSINNFVEALAAAGSGVQGVDAEPGRTAKRTKKKRKTESTEIPEVAEKDVFIRLPLLGGGVYPVSKDLVQYYRDLYPAVDVEQQFRNMLGWLNTNKRNRKTPGGIGKFMNGWLAREQNRAPRTGGPQAAGGSRRGNCSLPARKKNMFNDFEQNSYDFDALEGELQG